MVLQELTEIKKLIKYAFAEDRIENLETTYGISIERRPQKKFTENVLAISRHFVLLRFANRKKEDVDSSEQ